VYCSRERSPGAAGTATLNAVTYLDMAVRARPASETPQQAVAKLADRFGCPVPGTGEDKRYRLAGPGPLQGVGTGVGVGTVTGMLGPVRRRLPGPLAALLVGRAATAAANVPVKQLRVTDPATWSAPDWASDAIPHLAYGAVTLHGPAVWSRQRRRGLHGGGGPRAQAGNAYQ
jgi:hypothetical protein